MRLAVVVFAVALVTAGCAGSFTAERPVTESPAAEPTTATPRPPSPTPRPAGKVSVSGLPLSFDEEAVYRAVVELHGREYDTAPSVSLRVKERPAPSRTDQVWDVTEFMLLWGFDAAELNETSIAGLALRDRVFLYAEPVPTTADRKSVLAHEFTHVLQYDTDAFRRTITGIRRGEGSTERVYLAVVEGTATFVQARYGAEYLNESGSGTTWATYRANRSRFGTYVVAPYYFGTRYVAGRIDSVENISAVYDRPPTTTEQVLHGYGPGEEPARELSVTVEGDGSDWYAAERRVRGELFVRLVLEGQLGLDRAADAAAGWGADRVLRFAEAGTDRRAHAWVLRWDDDAEADEFADAMAAYLDARGERSGDRWTDGNVSFELRRAGDETVVVLAGPESFLAAATVEGGDGDVTVRVEE